MNKKDVHPDFRQPPDFNPQPEPLEHVNADDVPTVCPGCKRVVSVAEIMDDGRCIDCIPFPVQK